MTTKCVANSFCLVLQPGLKSPRLISPYRSCTGPENACVKVSHAHSSRFFITFFEVWFVESGKIPQSDECRNNTTCMLCQCHVKIKCLAKVCVPKSWNLQVAVKILRLQSHADMCSSILSPSPMHACIKRRRAIRSG